MTTRTVLISITLLSTLLVAGRAAAEPISDAEIGSIRKKLGAELQCELSERQRMTKNLVHRHWCGVMRLAKDPISAPGSIQLRVGMALGLPDGEPTATALLRRQFPIGVTLRPEGLSVTSFLPRDGQQDKALATLMNAFWDYVGGRSTVMEVPSPYATHLIDSVMRNRDMPFEPAREGAGVRGFGKLFRLEKSPIGPAYALFRRGPKGALVVLIPDVKVKLAGY